MVLIVIKLKVDKTGSSFNFDQILNIVTMPIFSQTSFNGLHFPDGIFLFLLRRQEPYGIFHMLLFFLKFSLNNKWLP